MPKVHANGIDIYYETQGEGPPLVLIPYLSADNACYAFQLADYTKHFRCFSLDPRGAGQSDKPEGPYSTELFADDVTAFMEALGLEAAHVAGASMGAAAGLWLAAKYPHKVRSLSLHCAWDKSDLFLQTVVGSWKALARGLNSVPDMVISGILPWCLTPETYAARPDYLQALADFVRARPEQPVAAFERQADAVITHDAQAQLARVRCRTLITVGARDVITSERFARRMHQAIAGSELQVYEGCAHAHFYERVEEFNQKTVAFLKQG